MSHVHIGYVLVAPLTLQSIPHPYKLSNNRVLYRLFRNAPDRIEFYSFHILCSNLFHSWVSIALNEKENSLYSPISNVIFLVSISWETKHADYGFKIISAFIYQTAGINSICKVFDNYNSEFINYHVWLDKLKFFPKYIWRYTTVNFRYKFIIWLFSVWF